MGMKGIFFTKGVISIALSEELDDDDDDDNGLDAGAIRMDDEFDFLLYSDDDDDDLARDARAVPNFSINWSKFLASDSLIMKMSGTLYFPHRMACNLERRAL